jgi:hypothetical protein
MTTDRHIVGDTFMLHGIGDFEKGVECIVTEIGQDGRIIKAKVVNKNEKLLKLGFFEEGNDYVTMEYHWSKN